jgi:formylglycine-generating enzyme required for sulfatase activity/serine/threonine protein kinase
VKTTAGEPWFSSGNFAVVFKMKHRSTGKLLALKCFTRFQERRQESYKLISAHLDTNKSPYLLHYNYLVNEIWAAGAEYPVVAMEWADGATLGDYLKEQCRLNNKANLQALAKNFEALTAWLITQPFAHGDLKPDNIIVRSDGSLALVDYDGMFVPEMQGQQSREFGSPVYRHPKRTIDTFDRYIDDFSLMVLLLELRLVALDAGHYSAALSGDSIVAKSGDWEDVAHSRIYRALQAQRGLDWATWAAMLFIVPKSNAFQIQDWSLLININVMPGAKPINTNPPSYLGKNSLIINNSGLSESDFKKALEKVLELPMKQNTYSSVIYRSNPTPIIFLLDQYESKKNNYKIKTETITSIINEILQYLIGICYKNDEIRDYFEIVIIGYGQEPESAVFLWEGSLKNRTFVKPSELVTSFISEENVSEEVIVREQAMTINKKKYHWIKLAPGSYNPLCHALELTSKLLEDWLVRTQDIDVFPPLVFNITGSESTDCKEHEIIKEANRIKELHTIDGNVLLFNMHFTDENQKALFFPVETMEFNDKYVQLLSSISSTLPESFWEINEYYNDGKFESNNIGLCSVSDIESLKLGIKEIISCLAIGDKKYRLGRYDTEAKSVEMPTGSQDPFEGQMVFVQGGSFMMGVNNGYDSKKPVHQVTLSDFYIGKYQITQAQWKAIMGNNPSYFKGDDLPVENISWNDVQEFIKKLNEKTGRKYRLPTEAEWEYAAQGGQNSKGYKYSGSDNLNEVAWNFYNSGNKTHPVGQKKSNELGLFDMSGNVSEWCQDWEGSDYYENIPVNNPIGPATGSYRIVRGGSWGTHTGYCNVSARGNIMPGRGDYNIGFRLLRTA